MNRKGSGFGLVMLVVVMAIVLLLVAKAWKKHGAAAIEVSTPAGTFEVDDHGQTEAAGEVRSGGLPNLQQMRQNTTEHADRVQDALEEID